MFEFWSSVSLYSLKIELVLAAAGGQTLFLCENLLITTIRIQLGARLSFVASTKLLWFYIFFFLFCTWNEHFQAKYLFYTHSHKHLHFLDRTKYREGREATQFGYQINLGEPNSYFKDFDHPLIRTVNGGSIYINDTNQKRFINYLFT